MSSRLSVYPQFLNLPGQRIATDAKLVRGLDASSASVLQGFGDEDALKGLDPAVENHLLSAAQCFRYTHGRDGARRLLQRNIGIKLYTV